MRESDRQPVIIANHEIAPACVVTLKPLPYQRCFSSPDCCQTSKSQKAVIPAMIVLHQLELAGTVLGERRFRVGSKTEVPGFARQSVLPSGADIVSPPPACQTCSSATGGGASMRARRRHHRHQSCGAVMNQIVIDLFRRFRRLQ